MEMHAEAERIKPGAKCLSDDARSRRTRLLSHGLWSEGSAPRIERRDASDDFGLTGRPRRESYGPSPRHCDITAKVEITLGIRPQILDVHIA